VRARKAGRPAIAIAMQRAAEFDHLGRTIEFYATPTLSEIQAAHAFQAGEARR